MFGFGTQGLSGLDLDWNVSSATPNITRVVLSTNGLTTGDGYGIDDLALDSGQLIPEPTTLVIWSLLATLGLSFGRRRRRRS
jgi:hypothetical protein